MRKESYTRIRISGLQMVGFILMTAGILMLVISGASAYKIAHLEKSGTVSEYEGDDYAVDDAEKSEEAILERKKSLDRLPLAFIGGMMIIASVPLFYASYNDKGLWLRLRRYRTEDYEDIEDDEFDYPDDDFDYILDEEIRARLIEERDRKIKEKRKRQKRAEKRRRRRMRRH